MISLNNVSISFGELQVLSDVTAHFPTGETTAILGKSGAGKSVILKLLVGLLKADSGQVNVLGTDLGSASEEELYTLRRRLGMLFQNAALFDSLTVAENVAFPLEQQRPRPDSKEIADRVAEALQSVGLKGFQARQVSDLSGGQRKRVGLARAIITRPEILLFDEPNSGLDPITSEAIDALICTMKRELGITFVVITHDIVGALKVADHLCMLHDGRIVEHAPIQQFLQSKHPVVRGFLNRNVSIDGQGGIRPPTIEEIRG
jgi:phospholipid/cholesterol/gamma-HCH transport system ATP-binding protein